MERRSQGSTVKPTPKSAMKDTEVVASGETGVHSLGSSTGWIKDYVAHPFDPDLDWRDPPPTADFGGRPAPASIRHSARRSTDLKIPGTLSWGLNPWYDLPSSRSPSDSEIARFERAKEAAMFNDFSSAYRWGMLLGAIPALLFVCGYLFGGQAAAMWLGLGGYLIMSLAASLVVEPRLTRRWLQTDTAKMLYNRTAEPFISMFYYGFAVIGAMLIGFPLMLITSFIMR